MFDLPSWNPTQCNMTAQNQVVINKNLTIPSTSIFFIALM